MAVIISIIVTMISSGSKVVIELDISGGFPAAALSVLVRKTESVPVILTEIV